MSADGRTLLVDPDDPPDVLLEPLLGLLLDPDELDPDELDPEELDLLLDPDELDPDELGPPITKRGVAKSDINIRSFACLSILGPSAYKPTCTGNNTIVRGIIMQRQAVGRGVRGGRPALARFSLHFELHTQHNPY